MIRTNRTFTVACAFLLLALAAGTAQAQATRTWVSGVGDDANPCSRTAPCKTFAGAISKTAAGGEISVLDPGGFGAVTITKNISLTNDKTGEAGILASGTNAININTAGVVVNLRGLVIDGGPTATPGLNGINFLQGSSLHVQDCIIKGFQAAGAANGSGIKFTPSTNAELYVSDCVISNNGNVAAATGAGINIQPTGSASVIAVLDRVQVEDNVNGVRADSSSTTGVVQVAISDTTSSGNTLTGIALVSDSGATKRTFVAIDRATLVKNGNFGVRVEGAAALAQIGNSVVVGHTKAFETISGGTVQSLKSSNYLGNATLGTIVPTDPQ